MLIVCVCVGELQGCYQRPESLRGILGMETQTLSRISVYALHRIDAQWIYSSKSDVC